jgi:hypothetical protein
MRCALWTTAVITLMGAIAGCQQTKSPTIVVPERSSSVQVFYRAGQPLAAMDADIVALLLNVTPYELAGARYLRVYLLYINRGSNPVLLTPATALRVRYKLPEWIDWRIGTPSTPTQMLNEVEAQKAKAQIAAIIGSQLRSLGDAMTTRPTTISGPGGTYEVNDVEEKLEARDLRNQSDLRARLAEQDRSFGLLASAVNQGVLRTNTVFPGEGVQGFLYVPVRLEQGRWITNANGTFFVAGGRAGRLEDCLALLDLTVPGVTKSIGFTPTVGE